MKQFFSFLCAVLLSTGLYAQQLNEGFEGESFPPEGWTVINGGTGNVWSKTAKAGKTCAMIPGNYGWGDGYLITPQLKPAAGEDLKFSAMIGDNASNGELRIEVSLAGTDVTSFEVLDTYYTSTKKGDAAHQLWKSEWKEYTIDLSAYQGSSIYIAFHQANDADKIYLTDIKGVSLKGTSSCENPSDIVLSNLEAHSATFTWQGDAAQYQYVLVEDGEEADWTTATLVTAKTATINNLYEETDYVFYVRSYCSADEQSLAPRVAFKTPCESFAIPWIETFTRDQTGSGFDVAEPDCWTVATKGTISVVKDKTYDDEGNASTVNGQAHLQALGGGPNSEQVFAMPTFTEALNTLEVAFDYKTGMTDATCGSPEIGYMTNPNKASTFVSLQTLAKSLTYGELYDDKWHPWKGADQLMLDGQNLQCENWREYPVYKGNFATIDADKIGEETDKWLAGLGYVREGLYYQNKRPDDQQRTLAIFCHGGASSAFLARVLNQTFPYMCALCHFSHTGISVLRFDKTPGSLAMPVLELLNDDRHLRDVE